MNLGCPPVHFSGGRLHNHVLKCQLFIWTSQTFKEFKEKQTNLMTKWESNYYLALFPNKAFSCFNLLHLTAFHHRNIVPGETTLLKDQAHVLCVHCLHMGRNSWLDWRSSHQPVSKRAHLVQKPPWLGLEFAISPELIRRVKLFVFLKIADNTNIMGLRNLLISTTAMTKGLLKCR